MCTSYRKLYLQKGWESATNQNYRQVHRCWAVSYVDSRKCIFSILTEMCKFAITATNHVKDCPGKRGKWRQRPSTAAKLRVQSLKINPESLKITVFFYCTCGGRKYLFCLVCLSWCIAVSLHRITTTAACMMDLRRYPLDEQNCTLEIESCKWRELTTVETPKVYIEAVFSIMCLIKTKRCSFFFSFSFLNIPLT